MITYGQIRRIAEMNDCKVEVNDRYSEPFGYPAIEDGRYVWKEKRAHLGFVIGVNNIYGRKGKSEWQWFWFETMLCPDTLEDDTELYFDHRYSMLTGKTHKGLWERVNVHDYIRRGGHEGEGTGRTIPSEK